MTLVSKENKLVHSLKEVKINWAEPVGLIFDVDELLYDNGGEIQAAYRSLLEVRGIKFDPRQQFPGKNLFEIIAAIKNKYNLKESVEDLVKERRERYIGLLKQSRGRCLKGVKELFHYLDQNRNALNVKIAYTSSSERAFLDIVLTKIFQDCDLKKYIPEPESFFYHHQGISVSTCWQDGLEKKPSPSLYLKTLEKLQIPSSQCIAFEDSLSGYEAARQAGLKVVLIPSLSFDEHFNHIPLGEFTGEGVCRLNSISDFIPVLESIRNSKDE